MKTYLKTLFVILSLTGIINISYSQPLTGPKNIPGDYATLAAAITALNTNGVGAGGVTFTIAAGYTETFATATTGTITASGTVANPIVFQKGVGTPNPLITASGLGTVAPNGSTAQHGDGIIIIVGGDYITFDGIDLRENPGTLGNARSEYGYYLKLASLTDACKNVTIKNCYISLDKTDIYSFGIFVSNIYEASSPTITSTGGRSENIKIYSNTITNCYGGILAQGYGSLSQDIWGQNIEIGVDGGNTINNFGGGASTAYAIYTNYQQNLKIANNIINGGTGTTGQLYGIRTDNGNNSNLDIYGNDITIQGGGLASSTNSGIYNAMGGAGTSNTVNIHDNIIENCTCTGATSTAMTPIYQSTNPFHINIYNNIIRNNSKPGTGALNCIYNTGVAANGISNIYNNSVYGNSNTAIAAVNCIYTTPNATATSYLYGNTVYNNSSAGGTVTGLYIGGGLNNFIYKNNIYNLSSTSATAALVYGINAAGGTNSYYYNNFISDLKAPAATNATSIAGINVSAGTTSNAYLYNNTVYLSASSTGASFGTAAVYVTITVPFVEMKNNIFVNASTPGTGKSVAYKRSAVGLTTYSGNSNFNCFYAGTPGVNNLIFSDGTNVQQTMAAFFALVTPRDGSSFSELPPFVNTTTTPYDLHLQTTLNTQCESGGSIISIPNITQDFDGDARYPNPGYPNKLGYPATAPDVGADEFAGQQNDLTPPVISYAAITNKPAGTSLTLNNFAVITDPSGVNTSPGTAPRLYFKRTIDANSFLGNTSSDDGWKYVETSSGSSPFSFTIDYTLVKGGTVSGGDIIQYFVVAQDNAGTPHVGINAGSFSTTPASVDLISTPGLTISSPFNSYNLTSTSLSGIITVGTGGTFTTLSSASGLFAAINAGVVSGNITVNIISDITTETGANALNQFTEYPDGSNYTITIQPDAATNRTISGSSTNGLIKLNGADRVTFDGRFGGSGNYLTIQNTNTVANTAAIQLISLGAGLGAVNNTIRNCNIKAGINTVTSTFGIYSGAATISTAGTGASNNNLSIQNNNISKCYYGVYAAGVANTGELSSLNISNNAIGSSTASDYVTGYGINIASASGPVVSGNEIFNMIFDANKYGIYFGTNVYNSSVSKNKIHGLGGIVSSSKSCVGIYFSTTTLVSNNTIDNNIIYDMSNIHNAGSNYGPYGIWIVGGTTFNIYYNSISLTGALGGTPVTGSTTSCLWISTLTTNMNLRNNILYNSMTGTFPRTFTFGSVTGTTFANINYNDYYTTSGYFAYLGVVIPTFTAWQIMTGQDANSKNIIPDFQSNTDLRPGLTSGLLNSATPILGFATDILGTARSVSTPTMGAYEQGVDASGPVITYTSFLNTSSTSNRTLSNVTMTDPGGVSSSPKPRMYYKKSTNANAFNDNTSGTDGWKYVESNGTTSPFDFTTDYSLLNGGAPGTGTTVQYFVVAQDMDIPTPYVSINSGTFAATPTSVALTSAAFPIGGTINSYNITTALSGIVTVGTGGTYPSLTGAGGLFATVNSSSIGGNITVNILSDLTEDNTNALNEFFNDGAKTNFTITIQPGDATMKVISGLAANTANGLITFNGCKGVTIDGRYGGSGKYLTFRNLNADNLGNNNYVIDMRNGSSGNTVQYCVLEGATTSNTCGVVFFDYGTNTSNKITDCDIKNSTAGKPYNGIYSGNLLNSSNDITKCIIYDFTTNGICIDASGGQIIDSNNIYLTAPSAAGPCGIFIANPGVTKILKNIIHDLDSQVGSNGRTNGIYYNPGSNPYPANISIENNFIDLVATVTNNTVWGININSTVANSNYVSVYYNSIYIGGSVNNATTSQAVGLYLQNVTMSGYVQKNNVVQCNRIFTGGGNGKNYAVFASSAPTLLSDYNDYYVNGTPGVLGYWYGYEFVTIGDWKTASGQDANTIYGDPMFISAADLHIQTSVVSPVSNAGTPIAGITTDIDNDTRSLTTPDIGADEYIYASSLNLGLSVMLSGYCNGTTMNFTKSVTVELHNSTTPYALVESQVVTLSTSGVGNPVYTTAVNGTPYYIVLKTNNGLETWSATPQTFTGSALNYDFTTAATQAYGSNMLLVGIKWCIISGDANQDGSVDALDRSACWNDRNLSGVYATDLNGDGTVDALDRSIAWNNRNLSVAKPALVLSPVKGVKQDNKVNNDKNGNTKGTFDLKLDGSNSKKVNKK